MIGTSPSARCPPSSGSCLGCGQPLRLQRETKLLKLLKLLNFSSPKVRGGTRRAALDGGHRSADAAGEQRTREGVLLYPSQCSCLKHPQQNAPHANCHSACQCLGCSLTSSLQLISSSEASWRFLSGTRAAPSLVPLVQAHQLSRG